MGMTSSLISENNVSDDLRGSLLVYLCCALFIVITLIFDLSVPLGVAGGVPYIAPVLLALWMPEGKSSIYLAVLCSLLTLVGFYLSAPGGELWKVLINRCLALFAIWVTAMLVFRWKTQEARLIQSVLREERYREQIHLESIKSARKILNHLSDQLRMVKMEAEKYSHVSPVALGTLSEMGDETNLLMSRLSEIEEMCSQALESHTPT